MNETINIKLGRLYRMTTEYRSVSLWLGSRPIAEWSDLWLHTWGADAVVLFGQKSEFKTARDQEDWVFLLELGVLVNAGRRYGGLAAGLSGYLWSIGYNLNGGQLLVRWDRLA
jgi:hypothetical protein